VVSPAPLRETIEQSDCVLLLGELISDISLGISAQLLSKSHVLIATARDVFIGRHQYQNVPLVRLVPRLVGGINRRSGVDNAPGAANQLSPEVLEPFTEDEPIKVRDVIAVVNEFLETHPNVPVVADTGDAMFASVDIRATKSWRLRTTPRWDFRFRPRWECRSPPDAARSCWSAMAQRLLYSR
jgi:indolepyruvate decarboxylase